MKSRSIKIFLFVGIIALSGVTLSKSRFEKLELFNKVLFLVESQYYREVDTTKLINGAIKGMISTLDPHSAFLDEDSFAKMNEDTQGEFGGLGIEVIQKDGVIIVMTPIEDTPAYRAGIKSGDRIVEINGESTLGLPLEEAVEKMRGKANSPIKVGVVREGEDGVISFELKREIIKIKPVKSALVENNYIYVRLVQFQKRSASSIIEEIKKLKRKAKKHGGAKGMVLDLRSNPGGLLDEAVSVSSIFLKEGVVVSTEGRDPKVKEIKYVKKTGYKDLKIPLAVLINGSSASASEIVAGALQDHSRGIIIGEQSFGKGTVQTIAKIDDTQGVKLTIAQYMTPKNRKIQALGIKPDVKIREVEGAWAEDNFAESSYIREADLRNHLTATIETKEEKEERVKREKREREKRRELLKNLKNKKKNKDKKAAKKKGPKEDYMVLQAINYLRGFGIYEKFKK